MTPKRTPERSPLELFQSHFHQILNLDHPLCRLARQIRWERFDATFGACYCPDNGRPGVPIRLMVGLHYLKHTFNESDESVVERWVENPYWQYFCGFEYMQHECPIHPTSLVKWRQRVGAEKLEMLLQETIRTAVKTKQVSPTQFQKVTIDTTVQEKAIAYPTDARLYTKMLLRLVTLAKRCGLSLRQTYVRKAPRTLKQQGRYAHARQFIRARKCARRLKTFLGRVVRDIRRKAETIDPTLDTFLERADRLLKQTRTSKDKLYSIDAPEVRCISKGKAHKRYEFGCKVSVATSNMDNWVLGIQALPGNPYDGHTLAAAIDQIERLIDHSVSDVFVDRGYRGHDYDGSAEVHLPGKHMPKISSTMRKRKRRRSAVEPKIGHLKSDHRMNRNFLKGVAGDQINAILAGAGANLRKLLRGLLHALGWLTLKHLLIRLKFALAITKCQPISVYP